MLEVSDQLRWACDVDAIPGYLPFQVLHRLPAGRANLWGHIAPLFARARVDHRPDHVRDDLARTLHEHAVAYADVFLGHIVKVVQRGFLDYDSADLHRLQNRIRHQHAGPPNIHADVEQL